MHEIIGPFLLTVAGVSFAATLIAQTMVIIAAFQSSVLDGILSIAAGPFYTLYFFFTKYHKPYKNYVLIAWLGGALLTVISIFPYMFFYFDVREGPAADAPSENEEYYYLDEATESGESQ